MTTCMYFTWTTEISWLKTDVCQLTMCMCYWHTDVNEIATICYCIIKLLQKHTRGTYHSNGNCIYTESINAIFFSKTHIENCTNFHFQTVRQTLFGFLKPTYPGKFNKLYTVIKSLHSYTMSKILNVEKLKRTQ